jgi:hypothetical protein
VRARAAGFFGGAVKDLFYEPCNALVTSPLDFEAALHKSVNTSQQHVSRSIGGGAAAFGHITRTLGHSLAAHNADSPHVALPSAPDSFQGGPAYMRSTQGEGVLGVEEWARRGEEAQREEGLGGVLAGFGKGLWSGMLRPTAGVTAGMLDLASRSSLSLANAVAGTSPNDMLEFEGRVRPPRPASLDGVLRAYDLEAAKGLDVLLRFEGGRYRHELLVCYVMLQSLDALLLTDKHLAVMQECTLEKRFRHKITDIASAATKGTGVLITIKAPAPSSSKFLTEALGVSSPVRERLLPCGDLDKAEYLASSINACRLAAAQDAVS